MSKKERQNRNNTLGFTKGLVVLLFGLTLLSGCSLLFGNTSSSQGAEQNTVSSSSQKEIVYIHVSLRSDDDVFYEEHTIVEGTLFSRPSFVPTKTNHTFVDWYSRGAVHDFSKPLYNDTLIIAKFSLDKAFVRTIIKANQLKANVMVLTKHYNTTFFGLFEIDVYYSQGSGAIFGTSETRYWLLTNNHVTEKKNREKRSFSVRDYKSNEYSATLHENSESRYHDLSTLYFTKGKEALATIKLSSVKGEEGREVIAIGQPKGEMNVITFGTIRAYEGVASLDDNGNIKWIYDFACIMHSAKTDNGSSGGMLLNHKLELVGIHFSGSDDGEGAAIPISEVRSYLNTYVYS